MSTDDTAEETPAEDADGDETLDEIRSDVQTVIRFLESVPTLEFSPRVQFAWDMAAISMLEHLKRSFTPTEMNDAVDGTRATADPGDVQSARVSPADSPGDGI